MRVLFAILAISGTTFACWIGHVWGQAAARAEDTTSVFDSQSGYVTLVAESGINYAVLCRHGDYWANGGESPDGLKSNVFRFAKAGRYLIGVPWSIGADECKWETRPDNVVEFHRAIQ